MTVLPKEVLYGGDYNPEQWPPRVWDEDQAAFDLAGINTLTINVFSWATLEPVEGSYNFTELDRIIGRIEQADRHIVLATSTGAMPPWLPLNHPDVLRTDFEGRCHVYGQRHNACPSSPSFRERSVALAEQLAIHYGGRESIIAWHIGNEYGGACYCRTCAAGFRVWLRERYGDLDRLNDAWNTSFWSHSYTDWAQIMPPNALSEHWKGEDYTAFQGTTLDYRRFMTDALLDCFLGEKEAIRRHDANTPVTTNFMGLFRPIDYFRWSEHLDFASWDNYPPDMHSEVRMALTHDLNRGLKKGQPFWVMEQTPSRTASRDVNPLKRPGVMGLWSWQAVAHGADAVLFFQMRASRGACEKYHGAVIDHSGRTDTRTFREVAALGAQFHDLADLTIGATTPARVALIWDWDSWWAWEMTDGVNRHLKYMDLVLSYYRAFWKLGVDVDVVPMDANLTKYDIVLAPLMHMIKGDIIDRLQVVAQRGGTVVTGLMSGRVDESDNAILCHAGSVLAELAGIQIEEVDAAEPGYEVGVQFVGLSVWPQGDSSTGKDAPLARLKVGAAGSEAVGGRTVSSGEAGEGRGMVKADRGHGGNERPAAGEAVGSPGIVEADRGDGGGEPGERGDSVGCVSCVGSLAMEVLTPLETDTIAVYGQEYYVGAPAVTRRRVGDGAVVYIATLLSEAGMDAIARQVADHHGLAGPSAQPLGIDHRTTGASPLAQGIEITHRHTIDNDFTFILNHSDAPVTLTAPANGTDLLSGATYATGQAMTLASKAVAVIHGPGQNRREGARP
ncbi:MAG: beta-galactosidase [Propionibacteriaceae bacterium]|nr:beta-galactosidase [Propionibacteriaceae bacterium]